MGGKEGIAGFVEIEPHCAAECLTDLLLAAWCALGNAMRIGKIRTGAVNADDPKALRTVLGQDNLEMIDPTANLSRIFGVPFQ
jgi:hypothetical protein